MMDLYEGSQAQSPPVLASGRRYLWTKKSFHTQRLLDKNGIAAHYCASTSSAVVKSFSSTRRAR